MSTRLQKQLKGALLGGTLASLLCAQGIARAVTEVEPNDTPANAQVLVISPTGEASASGMMGSAPGELTTDLDLYAFQATEGDVPYITVVSDGSWDPVAYLIRWDGALIGGNDDSATTDPVIDGTMIDSTGTWYIAVSPSGRFITSNNFAVDTNAFGDPQGGGAYTLVLQGVTPPATSGGGTDTGGGGTDTGGGGTDTGGGGTDTGGGGTDTGGGGTDTGGSRIVAITILRWDGAVSGLGKFKGEDPIPVAILSAADFDAKTVDKTSLTFGRTGDEQTLLRCDPKFRDVKIKRLKKDHRRDLVCYFRPDLAGFQVNDMEGTLKGRTMSGQPIEGSGLLRVMHLSKGKPGKAKKKK